MARFFSAKIRWFLTMVARNPLLWLTKRQKEIDPRFGSISDFGFLLLHDTFHLAVQRSLHFTAPEVALSGCCDFMTLPWWLCFVGKWTELRKQSSFSPLTTQCGSQSNGVPDFLALCNSSQMNPPQPWVGPIGWPTANKFHYFLLFPLCKPVFLHNLALCVQTATAADVFLLYNVQTSHIQSTFQTTFS